MREGECFAALDFFAFVTPFVTLDLQSSVIFICGFVIRIRQRFGLQIRFVDYAGLQIRRDGGVGVVNLFSFSRAYVRARVCVRETALHAFLHCFGGN